MADYNRNLWAPWRMDYIRSLDEEAKEAGCFLCQYWDDPSSDADNHVVCRGESAFIVMNRFPYTNGHLLVACSQHLGSPADLPDSVWTEMNQLIKAGIDLLQNVVKPQGFNIGYNLGQCAGAGLPGHLHAHIVPRWTGDTNYMAVIGDSRVVPDSLDALYAELIAQATKSELRP